MRCTLTLCTLACALSAGCPLPGPYGQPPEPRPPLPTPQIASFSVDCNVDAGTWSLVAESTAPTGGGVALFSSDLEYIEQHAVLVSASEPDGSGDTLQLTLVIVSDWRTQLSGRSTVFTCADAPTVAFNLLDTDGQTIDCRLEGPLAEALAELPDTDCDPSP